MTQLHAAQNETSIQYWILIFWLV